MMLKYLIQTSIFRYSKNYGSLTHETRIKDSVNMEDLICLLATVRTLKNPLTEWKSHWKKNWASFDTKRGVQIWVLRWTSKGDRVTPLKSVMTPWWCQFIVYTFGCSPEDPFLRVSNDTFSGVKVNLLGVNLLFTPLDVRLRTHF